MKEKIKILLVEDEKVAREMLKLILEDEGYDVSAFELGYQAVDKARLNFFNIAILDLNLPDMDGLEVLQQLKRITPDICGIIITAYPSVRTTVEAIEAEAYDYIIKPYKVEQIKSVIRRGLEKQNLVMENKWLLKKLKIEKDKLEQILIIGKSMSAILNLDDLVNFIVHKIVEFIPAEKASLLLVDEKTGDLVIKAAKGLSKAASKERRVAADNTISGMVAQQGKPLLVENIEKNSHLRSKNLSRYKTKSFLSLPLQTKDKVTGVFNITDKTSSDIDIFTEDDLKVLSVIIHQAAVAIENAKLYEKATCLAITDSVTGLFNHRYFHERLSQEVDRVERYAGNLSLIMFDVDSFKEYNDTYGHLPGDKALRDLADIIRASNRKVDIGARYGGEEFMIILPETSAKGAQVLAEKIRRAVESYPFAGKKSKTEGRLTVSAGVAEYGKKMSKGKFIDKADKALYKAKRSGKNRVCVLA
ncbi:MAG: diguanylate cyclase [Candidatus Omnitrophica bacterium]|nr:diguanylate cyclase [Candidatus Omnitrophota bacterium]